MPWPEIFWKPLSDPMGHHNCRHLPKMDESSLRGLTRSHTNDTLRGKDESALETNTHLVTIYHMDTGIWGRLTLVTLARVLHMLEYVD